MAISRKEFEEDCFYDKDGLVSRVVIFLKKNSMKAFTSNEISEDLKIPLSRTTQIVKNLIVVELVDSKIPYVCIARGLTPNKEARKISDVDRKLRFGRVYQLKEKEPKEEEPKEESKEPEPFEEEESKEETPEEEIEPYKLEDEDAEPEPFEPPKKKNDNIPSENDL